MIIAKPSIMMFLSLILLLLGASSAIKINDKTGEFTIFSPSSATPWISGGAVRLTSNGKALSSLDGSLVAGETTYASNFGEDKWGMYSQISIPWFTTGSDSVILETVFKVYEEDMIISFVQRYPNGVEGTTVNDRDGVISSFPTFVMGEECDKGFFTWAGPFIGRGRGGTFCNQADAREIPGGRQSGPMTIFNSDMSTVSMFSAAKNFMAFSSYTDPKTMEIQNGIMGRVTSIPKGYEIESMIVFGTGVNNVVSHWGDLMRHRYSNDRPMNGADTSLNYLGYSTDNGAYYYVQTIPGLNYEDTMISIKKHADEIGVPYRYALLDSWWYTKGINGSIKDWNARPDIFPHGLEYLHNATTWPFQAHNRYWGADNVYAKQNGGDYQFHIEKELALPLERRFWDDLFANASRWGMRVYEQDWLHNQYEWMNTPQEDVSMTRDWLVKMGDAAFSAGVSIQYCMPYPRHLLQTLEIPAVTQVRASNDYFVPQFFGNAQNWDIGISSLLMAALGVAPSKDSAWSTSVQPGDRKNHSEPFPVMQSAVLALSKGPVAFSDMIGGTDVDLVMKTCAMDGKLLQASQPARAIDSLFTYHAYGYGGPDGAVWASYSDIGPRRWHHVFSSDLKTPYQFGLNDLFRSVHEKDPLQAYSFDHRSGSLSIIMSNDITLVAQGTDDFELIHFAPILLHKWIVFGESLKWIPMSPSRVESVIATLDSVTVMVKGTPGETVSMDFGTTSEDRVSVASIKCIISTNGRGSLTYPALEHDVPSLSR